MVSRPDAPTRQPGHRHSPRRTPQRDGRTRSSPHHTTVDGRLHPKPDQPAPPAHRLTVGLGSYCVGLGAATVGPTTVPSAMVRITASISRAPWPRPISPAAPRTPRPHHRGTALVPQHPSPSPTPPPQLATTDRTHQLTPSQPVLDPSSVHPYREHSASARDTALPDALGQEEHREDLHMPSSPRCRRQPTPRRHRHTPRPSSHSMPGIRPRCRHLQRNTPIDPRAHQTSHAPAATG